VRNGSVIDLQVAPGEVTALVSGSRLYDVKVTIAAVPPARWKAVCAACSGAIDSVIELLQGRLSSSVMERICHEKTGLFPSPKEIAFTCSCPDWAGMCKHAAATLYGIGARLDERPEFMFTLRQVVADDLIARAGGDLSKATRSRKPRRVLEEGNLSEIFGIELDAEPAPAQQRASRAPAKVKSAPPASAKARKAKSSTDSMMARKRGLPNRPGKAAISESMRRYWAARKKRLAGDKPRG
jgi:uncharacterized Zn finger protein